MHLWAGREPFFLCTDSPDYTSIADLNDFDVFDADLVVDSVHRSSGSVVVSSLEWVAANDFLIDPV